MSTVIPIVFQTVVIVAMIGFVAGAAAHLQLQVCIDHRRVKAETGEPGWKIFGSILAPPEFYKPEARWVWRVRDIGLKTCVLCFGCMILLAVVAAVLDIPLP